VRNSWVLVAYPVIAMFEQERAKSGGQTESGGILIGSYRGPHMEITGFTKPAKKDLRQPYRFVKQDPRHQRAATRAWLASDGKDTYIGEWHTHPLGGPKPSTIDAATWRGLVATTKRTMIFVIVAPDGWALFRSQRRFIWTPFRQLIKVEEGHSGLVFRTH
jgi:integrative and conjugative element protein (TIGR02256 family)